MSVAKVGAHQIDINMTCCHSCFIWRQLSKVFIHTYYMIYLQKFDMLCENFYKTWQLHYLLETYIPNTFTKTLFNSNTFGTFSDGPWIASAEFMSLENHCTWVHTYGIWHSSLKCSEIQSHLLYDSIFTLYNTHWYQFLIIFSLFHIWRTKYCFTFLECFSLYVK